MSKYEGIDSEEIRIVEEEGYDPEQLSQESQDRMWKALIHGNAWGSNWEQLERERRFPGLYLIFAVALVVACLVWIITRFF